MDSLEANKAIAAVLVAGIAFSVGGVIAGVAVRPEPLRKSVLDIKGADTSATPQTASQEAPKPPPAIAPLLAKADVSAGGADAKKLCTSCHNFEEGAAAKVGPPLYGVVGRDRAAYPGFDYSSALKGKAGKWTYEDLNAWLTSPKTFAPGTKMSFAGIEDDKQRADVIDYLHSLAKAPEPLPPVTEVADKAPAAASGGKPAGGTAVPEPGSGSGKTGPAPQGGDKQGAEATSPASSGGGAAGQATQPGPTQNQSEDVHSQAQQPTQAKPATPAAPGSPGAQGKPPGQ